MVLLSLTAFTHRGTYIHTVYSVSAMYYTWCSPSRCGEPRECMKCSSLSLHSCTTSGTYIHTFKPPLVCAVHTKSLEKLFSYLRYISTFYIRRGIDFGSFKRDVLLFKSLVRRLPYIHTYITMLRLTIVTVNRLWFRCSTTISFRPCNLSLWTSYPLLWWDSMCMYGTWCTVSGHFIFPCMWRLSQGT